MIRFEHSLTDAEQATLDALPPDAWFTRIEFANWTSKAHQRFDWLDPKNEQKQALVADWIAQVSDGRTVLDTFSANGAFAFLAAQGGARAVTGVEWDPDRVAAARAVAEVLRAKGTATELSFLVGDVYQLTAMYMRPPSPLRRAVRWARWRRQGDAPPPYGPFDVTMCLGGLYHIADPAYVLRQLGVLTREWAIVQTTNVIPGDENVARFTVRDDATGDGLTSIRGGNGVLDVSVPCFRELLRHGGFEIVEEREDPPVFAALCRPFPRD